jgi:hypothetical protein
LMPSRKAITSLFVNSSNPPVWSASFRAEITFWTAGPCFATREAVISACSFSPEELRAHIGFVTICIQRPS